MKDAMKVLCKVCLLVAFFLTPLSALAQAQISGQVVDATGETVIGATIVEKGNPKNAAVTDFDGNFSIKVASGKILVISYVGMKTMKVAINPSYVQFHQIPHYILNLHHYFVKYHQIPFDNLQHHRMLSD